jgi:hypothetical protein
MSINGGVAPLSQKSQSSNSQHVISQGSEVAIVNQAVSGINKTLNFLKDKQK